MKPSSQMSWFVETRGVTLCSLDGSVRCSIGYPHAGLWALIANGNYSLASAIELMSVLMSVKRPEAERAVEDTLNAWKREGFISET
jgi:hypothetical protein